MVSLSIFYILFGSVLQCQISNALPISARNGLQNKGRSYDIPFTRNKGSRIRRRGSSSGESGLGDNSDLLYTVPIEIGGTTTAVHLDTGSSDLWVITENCTSSTCNESSATRYPLSSFNFSGADAIMSFGDSTTGTVAQGPIGFDTSSVGGIAIDGQPFSAVNYTNNPVIMYAAAGILGLGFPSGSQVQEAIVTEKSGPIVETDDFVSSTYAYGPLMSRISMTNALESPIFSVSLQRDTIEIGGEGLLTIGKLPDEVDNSSVTWVPVRLYDPADGGLQAPSFAPDEIYPFRWELDIDGVFLDGARLADSTVPVSGGVNATRVSALIDSGNSLLRGPSDVVTSILTSVDRTYNSNAASAQATFPCTTPHELAFQIGGKMFPVDPRDFIGPLEGDDATTCVADSLVSTDPPSVGALYRWSLGDPFFKSNLVAFHYGNLTHPSADPPMIGLMSMVPTNADQALASAVADAQEDDGNFESTYQAAPTASAATESQVTVFPIETSSTSIKFTSTSDSTTSLSSNTSATQTDNTSLASPQTSSLTTSIDHSSNGAFPAFQVMSLSAYFTFILLILTL